MNEKEYVSYNEKSEDIEHLNCSRDIIINNRNSYLKKMESYYEDKAYINSLVQEDEKERKDRKSKKEIALGKVKLENAIVIYSYKYLIYYF